MILIRISDNRLFIISDLWVIIPIILTIDLILIKIILKIAKAQSNQKLTKEEISKLKIFSLATNNIPNLIALIILRGGEKNERILTKIIDEQIEIHVSNCLVKKGLRYLNNSQLRNYIIRKFRHKAKRGIIYITKSALCYLVTTRNTEITNSFIYDLARFSLQLEVPDTRLFLKKTISLILLFGIPVPGAFITLVFKNSIVYISGFLSFVSFILGTLSCRSLYEESFLLLDSELITSSLKSIKPREENKIDIVSVDLVPSVPDRIDKIKMSSNVYDFDLKYEDTVNLKDVTCLDAKFSDQLEIIPPLKSEFEESSTPLKRNYLRRRAKMVNFLDKFKDPEEVPESEKWESRSKKFQEAVRIILDEL